ncbi:hypothetical protein Tco_0052051 [Tanacetum coccineum]
MTGVPVKQVARNDDNPNNSPSLQLIKQHNEKSGTLIEPIRLTFGDEEEGDKAKACDKGTEEEKDEDLQKSYKEVLKSPFTRRIIEFSAPNQQMPKNWKLYNGSTDLDDHVTRIMGATNQGEWQIPVWWRMFQQTLDGPARDPTEVSKIIRKANETLPDFKERWTEEMTYIQDVPEVMQISVLMSNSKFPELARRFSDQVSKTVTEMMRRVDDFVKSEEAYKSTELTRGKFLRKDKEHHTGEAGNARGRQPGNNNGKGKVINMVWAKGENQKRKVELEVAFGSEGLYRRLMMKFTVVRASSPYNIILGRTGIRELKAVLSTIHVTMKFLTPMGIATLVARTTSVFECRRLEKKQVEQEEKAEEVEPERQKKSTEEEVLINTAISEQKVTIRTQFSKEWRLQLINLLKNNMDVFAWQPSNITRVPKQIIKHTLNVNLSIPPMAHKRRVVVTEKSRAVRNEVKEWVKAGIVRPVKYPTLISNLVLVNKVDDTWKMCIDFKNINVACPKDYYPLPEIDLKIEAVMGFLMRIFF